MDKSNSKIQLFLVFGGESAEHEVSVDSARYVYSLLDKQRYDISLGYIDKEGFWWALDTIDQDLNRLSNELTPHLGKGELIDGKGKGMRPTIILPITLGPNGEDGSIQALAQLLHVPVVGCGILGSAICMDKDVTKRLLLEAGVPVADYMIHYSVDPELDFAEVTRRLGKTIFIKPANLGSSVGVSKVDTAEAFTRAMAEAHQHDCKVLIESAVVGSEVGCGVIGNDRPEASAVSEIKLGSNDFFTYDAKYSADSTAQMIIPADFAPEVSEKIRKTAILAYTTLECRGFARVDLFLAEDGKVLVNELNTIPAFRSDSSYPKLWKATGVDPSTLLDKVIDFAFE
jgi:D-alanine-D-alanine ligase